MVGTETIKISGQDVRTLRELLRPGLKAVFVGINPSRVSVDAGHYYQASSVVGFGIGYNNIASRQPCRSAARILLPLIKALVSLI
ncbi:MAG: hypothetical protein JO366_21040 [Methylobacteriaceae bacterium]|nr:hypothetical protein [Methylobacteriaceae bacterium]